MEKDGELRLDWVGLPVIATVARLLCRELTLQNEYLRLENRLLKEKMPGRLRFTDEERRSLVEAALAMGRSLMKKVLSIVKPETILAWQRRLERRKWDCSARRAPGRPRTSDDIETWSAAWRGRTPGATSAPEGNCSSWASRARRAASRAFCGATDCPHRQSDPRPPREPAGAAGSDRRNP
jgi:hypothetical protein